MTLYAKQLPSHPFLLLGGGGRRVHGSYKLKYMCIIIEVVRSQAGGESGVEIASGESRAPPPPPSRWGSDVSVALHRSLHKQVRV